MVVGVLDPMLSLVIFDSVVENCSSFNRGVELVVGASYSMASAATFQAGE